MTQFSTRLYVHWQFLYSLPLVLPIRCCLLLPAAFSVKNVANYTSSLTGGVQRAAWRMCDWEAASDRCGTFSILNQIIKHIGGTSSTHISAWVSGGLDRVGGALQTCWQMEITRESRTRLVSAHVHELLSQQYLSGDVLRLLASLVVCSI